MKKQLFLGIALLSVLMLVGCQGVDVSQLSDKDMERIAEKAIVCNEPYIRFGTGCCLDQNNNSICDNDEKVAAQTKTPATGSQITIDENGKQVTQIYSDTTCVTDQNCLDWLRSQGAPAGIPAKCTNGKCVFTDTTNAESQVTAPSSPTNDDVQATPEPICSNECKIAIDSMGVQGPYVDGADIGKESNTVYRCDYNMLYEGQNCTAWFLEAVCPNGVEIYPSNRNAVQPYKCLGSQQSTQTATNLPDGTDAVLTIKSLSQPVYAAGGAGQTLTYSLTLNGEAIDILNYCYKVGGNGCEIVTLTTDAQWPAVYLTRSDPRIDLANKNQIQWSCNYMDDDPGKNRDYANDCIQNCQSKEYRLVIQSKGGRDSMLFSNRLNYQYMSSYAPACQ